jgi:hypothetical protein
MTPGECAKEWQSEHEYDRFRMQAGVSLGSTEKGKSEDSPQGICAGKCGSDIKENASVASC